jgi:oligoendopeptidase F
MKGLYYKSVNDPQIEKDVQYAEKAYAQFAKKYRKSAFTTNVNVLRAALDDSNKLSQDARIGKPTRYLALLTALNSGHDQANKKLQLFGQRLTLAGNELLFFSLRLGKIPKKTQRKFLNDARLKQYKYDLKQLFENAKHQLSEPEEKILRQLSACSYDMWVEATEKMLGKRTIKYKGKSIPVNTAFDTLNSLPARERQKFWNLTMTAIDPLKEVVEHELTAVATRKKISDELRGYPKPYSAAVIAHEDDEKSVEALIDAVSNKGFKLSQKFYRLKAKIHNRETLSYAERAIPIGASPTVPFNVSTDICRDVFYGVNQKYGEIFDRLLTNGQIDVYPQPGKRGGAFCWGDIGQPTNVFLNQVDTVRSMETYAHEMGHAIHTERSKVQPAHYQGYSTTTAETASTLFEGILFNELYKQASEEQKPTLLHDKLIGDISTIQRQIAFHNFELEMHTTVREQGAITHSELNALMQKHLKSYLGSAVAVNELDGNSYIYVSHFRYGFYVYTYTFGILMSSIMANELAQDATYTKKIDTFLTAGGSDTVANIFKSIGLNTKKIETFERGLEQMATEISLLQKLTR